MRNTEGVSRRMLLQALVTAPVAPAFAIRGHGQIKPPLLVPDIALVRYDGTGAGLLALATGHVTAVQLMFTRCTTTCPIQAAIFQRVQKTLQDTPHRDIQLLSLSIDPEGDTPKALSAWRHRFHAGRQWIAAAPAVKDEARVRDFFQKGSDSSDHSTQVHVLDRNGRLVWRTYELPAAEEVAAILRKV